MQKKEEILVTVLCIAYNHEKYIRSALEGFVSQQTSFEYEVIVHDDASTDGTADIIREYEQKYPDIIKPIYQTENQIQKGVNLTTEFLLPNAKGKYIAYCEGDDFWCDENKLQLMVDALEANPEAYMCTHKVQCLNEDGSITNSVIPNKKAGLNQNTTLSSSEMADMIYVKYGYVFHTSSYVVRREVIEYDLFHQMKEMMNGDRVLLNITMMLGKTIYIDKIMSCRRLWTVGNWNSRFKKKAISEKFEYYKKELLAVKKFDEISKHCFHKQLSYYIFKQLLWMGLRFDVNDVRKLLLEHKVENKFDTSYSMKVNFAYALMMYAPWCYKFYQIVKTKL